MNSPPQQWYVCDACDGSSEIVRGEWGCEPGCGHRHMMEIGETCGKCNGEGGRVDDVKPDLDYESAMASEHGPDFMREW
jgi:hypothetical protein